MSSAERELKGAEVNGCYPEIVLYGVLLLSCRDGS
jgi:hypothetical protein